MPLRGFLLNFVRLGLLTPFSRGVVILRQVQGLSRKIFRGFWIPVCDVGVFREFEGFGSRRSKRAIQSERRPRRYSHRLGAWRMLKGSLILIILKNLFNTKVLNLRHEAGRPAPFSKLAEQSHAPRRAYKYVNINV